MSARVIALSTAEKSSRQRWPEFFALGLVLGILVPAACSEVVAPLTAQDKVELAAYDAEQAQCLDLPTSPQRHACVQGVRLKWRAHWNERFDGGF